MLLRFFGILLFVTLWFQSGNSQPYTFRTYSLAEGLPQSQVLCSMTDTRGYLWLGTAGGGLCRFDGKTFTVFTMEDGLPSNFIRSIYQYEDFGLLIGTSRGLCHYDGHQLKAYKDFDEGINAITAHDSLHMLIGMNNGLFVFDLKNENSQLLAGDSLGMILSLHSVNNKTWIGTTNGLFSLDKNRRITFHGKMLGQGIYSITSKDDNSLWLASWNIGIIAYNATDLKIDTVFRDLVVQLPQYLFRDNKKSLWVGTQNNGMVLYDFVKNIRTQLNEKDGLPHPNVKSITADQNGQIWIATSGGGLSQCLSQNFRQFIKSDGLASNRVYATFTDSENNLWLAYGGGMIQRYDGTALTTFHLDSLIEGAKCKSITEDHRHRIWIGTEGKGIVVLGGNNNITIRRQHGLPDDYIQKIVADTQGKIWVATLTKGLASITLDSFGVPYINKLPLPFEKLSSLHIDNDGLLWVGSNDGRLICIENNVVTWSSSSSNNLPPNAIKSIVTDSLGRIWIGTESQGAWYAGKKSTTSFIKADSLSSQNIYVLLDDRQGHMWAGSEKGVDRISYTSKGKISDVTFFGKNEGFTGIETCHDAATVDSNHVIWFGTMNGLMRYIPGERITTHSPPAVHFENISILYKPIVNSQYAAYALPTGSLRDGLVLDYNDNHLSFDFKAVDLSYPDQIQYRYKLEGTDADWSPATEKSNVNFASLAPGTYTLLVQAATDDLQWSEPVTASFTIRAPFWQQTWFWITLGLLAVVFIYLFFKVWSARLRKQEQQKRQQLELQNHLLQLEQKSLQLQMNPHFLFNALTSIKSLVARQNLSAAQEEINAFAQLMRGVLNNSRKQSITLAEEILVLEKYLHLEQFCHQDKFEYKITVAPDLDLQEIEIPPMLIQPFVENAVVHGVTNLQHRGKIEIKFARKGELIECTIEDNGMGREKAARLREEKKPGHQPVAVEVTRERLEALRDGAAYIPLQIEDIVHSNNEIGGTRVILRLPSNGLW